MVKKVTGHTVNIYYLFTHTYTHTQVNKKGYSCSNMDGSRDYHTKWSKSHRERQISYDITYMWNLKYDTNGLI